MAVTHHDPALGLRLSVCLKRARLDREIARGRSCEATSALNLRGRQLVERETRTRAAGSLREIVDYADRARHGPVFSAVVIDCRAVRAGREAILGLAERLESSALVSARGVASIQILLTEGHESPLFNPHCRRTVVEAVWEAADLLGADAPTTGFDAVAF
jgi:hypothetical protein